MMQKREQEVYLALQCKHSKNNIFATKNFFLGMSIKNIF